VVRALNLPRSIIHDGRLHSGIPRNSSSILSFLLHHFLRFAYLRKGIEYGVTLQSVSISGKLSFTHKWPVPSILGHKPGPGIEKLSAPPSCASGRRWIESKTNCSMTTIVWIGSFNSLEATLTSPSRWPPNASWVFPFPYCVTVILSSDFFPTCIERSSTHPDWPNDAMEVGGVDAWVPWRHQRIHRILPTVIPTPCDFSAPLPIVLAHLLSSPILFSSWHRDIHGFLSLSHHLTALPFALVCLIQAVRVVPPKSAIHVRWGSKAIWEHPRLAPGTGCGAGAIEQAQGIERVEQRVVQGAQWGDGHCWSGRDCGCNGVDWFREGLCWYVHTLCSFHSLVAMRWMTHFNTLAGADIKEMKDKTCVLRSAFSHANGSSNAKFCSLGGVQEQVFRELGRPHQAPQTRDRRRQRICCTSPLSILPCALSGWLCMDLTL